MIHQIIFIKFLFFVRTDVRGDFNIHGTKYFQDAVFHQKSKIYDVVSLLYLWLAKKPQHHNFLIFYEKQHPKNIWYHGC